VNQIRCVDSNQITGSAETTGILIIPTGTTALTRFASNNHQLSWYATRHPGSVEISAGDSDQIRILGEPIVALSIPTGETALTRFHQIAVKYSYAQYGT
jgi:hypothetical protein